jgi:hypothetical protein
MGGRALRKRLCMLQVTPENPNPDHVNFFKDKQNCDFYFVTHDAEHKDALKFCPNTRWADTRNILAAEVPKEYEYYGFIDYDYILSPQRSLGPLEQIFEDLELFEPAILTYYPGETLITPYAQDKEYRDSKDYSCIPFTHAGFKIVHHSLMKWFFPMTTNFSADVDSCHLFNIQEIPFLKHVVCSHKMVYDNGVSDDNASYNKAGGYTTYKMDEMWRHLLPAFKQKKLINAVGQKKTFALSIKDSLVYALRKKELTPDSSPKDINYFNKDRIEKFFNLEHEYFHNKDMSVQEQYSEISDKYKEEIESFLRKEVSYNTLLTKENPWPQIIKKINSKFDNYRNITDNECVEIFQNMEDNKSLFIKNAEIDNNLCDFLKGKRVAIVGPGPHLSGAKKGELIDSYDVVVRVQTEVGNAVDFGEKIDIVQSCLNSHYSSKVANYLKKEDCKKPKFIICHDTVARETFYGSDEWHDTVEEYNNYLKKYNIPFSHCKRKDDQWDRWALYWEVYPKQHVEMLGDDLLIEFTENFNSGYGAINHMLRYPIEELAIFGYSFYNFGHVKNMRDKYSEAYIDGIGSSEEANLGPSSALHDQLSQIIHFKNVIMKDPRVTLESEILIKLDDPNLQKRLNKFKKLPKKLHWTR